MRASVSDVMLFRKCPQAWRHSLEWSAVSSYAMNRGTHIHNQIAQLLTDGKCEDLTVMEKCGAIISQLKNTYSIVAVEKALSIDVGGHTILARPDAVLFDIGSKSIYSFQIKTSSRSIARHIEYVRISPHETVYRTAIKDAFGVTPEKIIMLQYIQTNAAAPKITVNLETIPYPSEEIMQQTMKSVINTLDDMERALQSTFTNRHTERCIDWTTGAQCGYYHMCHQNCDPDIVCVPAEDRYKDLVTKEKQYHDKLFPHPGDINILGGVDDI